MENEECTFENRPLRRLDKVYHYETAKENLTKQNVNCFPITSATKAKAENSVECIDKDVIEQIEELISTRMLFEENVANIEKLLSGFKVIKVGMLRNIFENVSGFVVLILGLCVYWVIGSYVFFMISIYYAYNAADYLWRKHFSQKRLQQLNEMLKANYTLFKRTLKFINDNDKIMKLDIQNNLHNKYKLHYNLKEEFAKAENEIITILTAATKKLIQKFPFYDYIEDPQYYFCNTYQQSFVDIDASKLFHVYLLVQSEFLQRLAMSFIPNIKKSGKGNCLELYKIVKETSILLRRLENKFNKKFKVVFLKGICDTDKISLNVSKNELGFVGNQYRNDLISNIQDISNSFQQLLIRSRTVECNLSVEGTNQSVKDELTDIQKELNLCQRNISDSLIVLEKFSNKSRDTVSVQNNLVNKVEIDDQKIIDLEGKECEVEDEIFEAYFKGDVKKEEEDIYDFDDYMKKKLERDYSELVLTELKTKIMERAKEWKMREDNAVIRRFVEHDVWSKNELMGDTSDDDKQYLCKSVVTNLGISCEDSIKADIDLCENRDESLGRTASTFLTDIFNAREKLIKTPISEEYFCNSDSENSNE